MQHHGKKTHREVRTAGNAGRVGSDPGYQNHPTRHQGAATKQTKHKRQQDSIKKCPTKHCNAADIKLVQSRAI